MGFRRLLALIGEIKCKMTGEIDCMPTRTSYPPEDGSGQRGTDH